MAATSERLPAACQTDVATTASSTGASTWTGSARAWGEGSQGAERESVMGRGRSISRFILAAAVLLALVSTSFEEGSCWSACWSPDSQWLAFPAAEVTDLVRNKRLSDASDWDLYVARPDGSEVRRLLQTPRWEYGCGWTPDGTRIILRSAGPPEDGD